MDNVKIAKELVRLAKSVQGGEGFIRDMHDAYGKKDYVKVLYSIQNLGNWASRQDNYKLEKECADLEKKLKTALQFIAGLEREMHNLRSLI